MEDEIYKYLLDNREEYQYNIQYLHSDGYSYSGSTLVDGSKFNNCTLGYNSHREGFVYSSDNVINVTAEFYKKIKIKLRKVKLDRIRDARII